MTGSGVVGRFAPSPTGPLHLGNLRTALVAWLSARSAGGDFLVRMEDLDRVTSSAAHAERQIGDLHALGITHDGEIVFQSDRFALYRAAIDRLTDAGLTYKCFCTRREIREAAEAPHGPGTPDGAYPGTCRDLTESECAHREAQGRRPALRLRTDGVGPVTFTDGFVGEYTGAVDDVVLQRNDGVPAYNLAVVVDDADQGVTEVVRGDDLLDSTPRQVHLRRLLGLAPVRHVHIPLVLGPDRSRLAKRHGAVTCDQLAAAGWSVGDVLSWLAVSIGSAEPGEPVTIDDLLERFTLGSLPRTPWVWHDDRP